MPFNTIYKYTRADCVVLDDDEAKIAMHRPTQPDGKHMGQIAKINEAETTAGSK